MTQLFANAARAELAATINDTDTTISVVDFGALFPVANTGTAAISESLDWFKLTIQDKDNYEIVFVRTHASGSNEFSNILRGQEGTVARSFLAGSIIGLRPTAGDAASVLASLGDKADKAAQELAGGVDLNTIQTPGFYFQPLNDWAASGTNYPVPRAGALMVLKNAGGVTQSYYSVGPDSQLFFRSYYGAPLNQWSTWREVYHSGNINTANAGTATKLQTASYDARGNLRTMTAQTGNMVLVEGLGLFRFIAGSDEPDDDESCFATATGRWLLECPHWDVVSLWQLPDDAVRDEYDEDEPLRFASSFASKVLSGTATCAITSVASDSSASFTGAVTGASVGDRVIATPPAELGATAAETGRLSYHARVSAPNTVTVMLTNGSAAAANTNAAIHAAWPITVIKS